MEMGMGKRVSKWRDMIKDRFPRTDRAPDIILLLVTLILVTVGTVMIYSSSSIIAAARYQDGQHFLKKQLIFVLIGITGMIILTRFPYQQMKKYAYPGIAVSIVVLALLFVPPLGVRAGGAARWLNLGFISFQVTEAVKIAMILFFAHFLTKKSLHIKDFKKGLAVPLLVSAPILGLIVLEPDFGTAAIITVILLLMIYLAGSRIAHLLGLAAAFAPLGLWLVIHYSYRMKRWTAFRTPWADPQGSGFQIIQSLLSFGSGGAFGVGLGDGMQKLFYLPEPHTDFILSVIAEEGGFIAVLTVITLFTVFVVRGFLIAFKAPDTFGTLLAAGLTMVIALEAFINIAGVMGLIPLKGLALPFLSYGGSALIMSMAATGILLNISSQEA
jgi:cell division protein FtsW